MNIYLDESGDLGWKFNHPYRRGGSSRFLTIAYIICPPSKKELLKRIVKKIYQKYGVDPKTELKGSMLNNIQKEYVASRVANLLIANPDVIIGAITVKKQNVQTHIREDSNKLYNYMLKLAFLDKIRLYPEVALVRDNRSIKVKSGNSLIDYLQTTLWFEMKSTCKLQDFPSDSKAVHNLVLVDWICNIVWGACEDSNREPLKPLRGKVQLQSLFFS